MNEDNQLHLLGKIIINLVYLFRCCQLQFALNFMITVLYCRRKLTKGLACKFSSLGIFSMLLMTCIVLDVTIVLYKNILAVYLVWHICQKGKRSLVVQTSICPAPKYICITTPISKTSVKFFKFFRLHLWYKLVGKDIFVNECYLY